MKHLLISTVAFGFFQVAFSTISTDDFTNLTETSNATNRSDHGRQLSNCIPGTDLRTGVYYKLSLRTFPYGVVTYTSPWKIAGSLTHTYLQVRQEGTSRMPNYEPGGAYYNDAQFMFLPSYIPGYFEIINRGLPGKKLVVSRDEEEDQGYYLVMDPDSDNRPQADSLFKPVRVERSGVNSCRGASCKYYYRLESLSVADGVVTYGLNKYGRDAYYVILNDPVKDKMNKFKRGGAWYRHSFLLFEPVTQ